MQSIRFPGADAPVPNWFSSMNLLALGGVLAALGVLLFVLIALVAMFGGSKRAPEMVAELKDLRPALRPAGS
jgi:Zn-dependent membrane protease YugP